MATKQPAVQVYMRKGNEFHLWNFVNGHWTPASKRGKKRSKFVHARTISALEEAKEFGVTAPTTLPFCILRNLDASHFIDE